MIQNTNILDALRNDRSREVWKPRKLSSLFSESFLCTKQEKKESNSIILKDLSFYEVQKNLLLFGESVFENWYSILRHFKDFEVVNLWGTAALSSLQKRLERAEYSFFDTLENDSSVEIVRNGFWSEELDSIVFNKNYSRRLEPEEYFINFTHPSIKSISRKGYTYSIQTYSDDPLGVHISTPARSFYELNVDKKSYFFEEKVSFELPRATGFSILLDEAIYLYSITIDGLFEYEEEDNTGEKEIIFKPFEIDTNKESISIFVEGDKALQGKISYRLFDGISWSEYKDYEGEVSFFDLENFALTGSLESLPQYPERGLFEEDLSEFYSGDYLFNPSKSFFLYDTDSFSSWTIDSKWRTYIYSPNDVIVDLGGFSIVLDNKKLTGKIKIEKGVHLLEIDSEFIYSANSKDDDIYYPHNLYHLFRGDFDYPKSFVTARQIHKYTTSANVLYGSSFSFLFSFVILQNKLRLITKSSSEDILKKKMMFILNKKNKSTFKKVQVKINFDRSFIGSIDNIGVLFK